MNQPELPKTLLGLDGLSDDALIQIKPLIKMRVVPFSKSTAWRRARQGLFPNPVKVSEQITAWRVGDIRKWQKDPSSYRSTPTNRCRLRGLPSSDMKEIKAAQRAGKSAAEISELAKELKERRLRKKDQSEGRSA